ncbi:uncharacterized protein LOC128941405 [Melozone crissalis]|uniref:uncharacterized protein LOC128941405 n=1 Tax=Melozone crissalis TaxID=40204 RepID=UPI0023D9F2E0|nr:uncharacterized protein LOC128941405 [Melozone crissalis]
MCEHPSASEGFGLCSQQTESLLADEMGEDPVADELGLPGPPCFAGGWEWTVLPQPASRTPPRSEMGAAPVSEASPPLPVLPLRVILSPPLQAAPPAASPASLLAAESLLPGDDNASPASGSAEEISLAPSAPPPLPSAFPSPQAETVPVQEGAGDSAEPAGHSEKPAAAPTSSVIPSPVPASLPLPAQAAPAVLPLSETQSSVSESETALEPAACSSSDHPGLAAPAAAPVAGLPFRGAGSARQLTGPSLSKALAYLNPRCMASPPPPSPQIAGEI